MLRRDFIKISDARAAAGILPLMRPDPADQEHFAESAGLAPTHACK